jgi:subtilase family serine protease
MFKCYLKECKTRASQTYKVNEIAKIYKFPNPTTDPVTISVVSFGGGLFGTVSPSGVLTGSDMETYWTSIGIPLSNQPKVIIIPVDGAVNTPVADQGETQENTLDITMIGGCCPTSKLTILFFLAPNSLAGFPNLITKAVTPITIDGVLYTPSVVSISWGAPEIDYSATLLRTIDDVLKNATQAGINICVASGDNGSTDGVPGTENYVDFPSSSPYVTACGGTTLLCPSLTYSDSTTVETVWPGSGGGVSRTFSKPTWQIPIVGATGSNRCSPDIALVADPSTGVEFLIGGKKSIFGGTSIVAPAMSAYYACLNTKRFLSPSIYTAAVAVPTAFHDITVGSNGAYSAKPGFDFCTGFGSIAGDILAAQLVSAPPPITVPVSGISLDTLTATLAVGNQMRVVAVITPANATNKGVLWESSGPGATVVGIACPNISMSVCECSNCECSQEVVPMISECDCVIPSYSSCDCKLKDPRIIACGCAGPSVIACGCAGPWRRRARSNARVSFSSCDCSNACECAQGGECNVL